MSNMEKYLCDGWWKLYFGGCYLFTIQSATMEKSDKERIEKEAEELVNKSTGDSFLKAGRKKWYISAATAEHERAQQELQAYRDIIKELLPLAETLSVIHIHKDEWHNRKVIIDRAKKLIDTVTPT